MFTRWVAEVVAGSIKDKTNNAKTTGRQRRRRRDVEPINYFTTEQTSPNCQENYLRLMLCVNSLQGRLISGIYQVSRRADTTDERERPHWSKENKTEQRKRGFTYHPHIHIQKLRLNYASRSMEVKFFGTN